MGSMLTSSGPCLYFYRRKRQFHVDVMIKYYKRWRYDEILQKSQRMSTEPFFTWTNMNDDQSGCWRCSCTFLIFYICYIPKVTHWHSPHFHAYYPTANSFPAICADILSDAIGCIGFSWVRFVVWQYAS